MATSDTLESDASQPKYRNPGIGGFAGDMKDRLLGKGYFRKDASTTSSAKADARDLHKGDRAKNPDAYAKGGAVPNRPKPALTMNAFEQSKFDKDSRAAPEGSPADRTRDKKLMAAENRKRGYADGGFIIPPATINKSLASFGVGSSTDANDAAGGPTRVRRGYGKARGA